TSTDKVRAPETKDSKRLTAGLVLRSPIAAKTAGGDTAAFDAAFKKELAAQVSPLPWEKVREDITQAKGRAEYVSRDLIIGSLKGQLDPFVEQAKGEHNGDLAKGLLGARAALDVILPLNPLLPGGYCK